MVARPHMDREVLRQSRKAGILTCAAKKERQGATQAGVPVLIDLVLGRLETPALRAGLLTDGPSTLRDNTASVLRNTSP